MNVYSPLKHRPAGSNTHTARTRFHLLAERTAARGLKADQAEYFTGTPGVDPAEALEAVDAAFDLLDMHLADFLRHPVWAPYVAQHLRDEINAPAEWEPGILAFVRDELLTQAAVFGGIEAADAASALDEAIAAR
jgi:hypothetical protein